MKDEFIELYRSNIQQPGADELLTWILTKSDFMRAPASSKYHMCREGGLVEHSINVYNRLKTLVNVEKESLWSESSIAIVSLLHDICKANFYVKTKKNVKVGGRWVEQEIFTINDQLPYGHGEKSVYIIRGYLDLKREEAMAIRFHMGYLFDGGYDYKRNVSRVFQEYPLALLLHTADSLASNIDEKDTIPKGYL